jgi:tetratricopeptide (TPR) repeat protein
LSLATLGAVTFDIQDRLKNLPASSPVRRRLLSTALEHLERLSGEFVKKSFVDLQTAVALGSMGDLVLQFGESPRAGNAGRAAGLGSAEQRSAVESARRFFTRSNEILQALVQADPYNTLAMQSLADSYARLGNVHLRLGATDEALQAYQKELELCGALAQADPNNVDAKRGLAFSHQQLGDVHLRRGATDEALQTYQKSLELREALAQADPNDARAKTDLGWAYIKLGEVQLQLGATEKALKSFQ